MQNGKHAYPAKKTTPAIITHLFPGILYKNQSLEAIPYSANTPMTPAITIAPTFSATFATAAPVDTPVGALGVAWKVTLALGMTLFERTTALVDEDIVTKPVGTVVLPVGVRTGRL